MNTCLVLLYKICLGTQWGVAVRLLGIGDILFVDTQTHFCTAGSLYRLSECRLLPKGVTVQHADDQYVSSLYNCTLRYYLNK